MALADTCRVANDNAVIVALESVLSGDPNNMAVRLHLVGLLIGAGRADEALAHARVVLASDPVNHEGLGLAAVAAGLVGDAKAEAGYSAVLAALQGNASKPPRPLSPEPPTLSRPVSFDDGPAIDDPFDERDGDAAAPAAGTIDPAIERPQHTLAAVAGMEQVKRQLQLAFLGPMRNAELRQAFGTNLRGGLLLYGPPGCGKTFLARALAGELGAHFFSIGLADVLDMWMGQSERNIRELFETARRAAPCVMFFDEVDALGQKRSHLRHSGSMRNVVAQLLTELDGTGGSNDGVFVLAATNHPWDVDVALRRPGRFDRTILVLPPDQPAREAILAMNLASRACAPDLDLRSIAAATEGYSGADLAHLCETAAQAALARSLDAGRIVPIGRHDVRKAAKDVRRSTDAWFETAGNFATFANGAGEYDDLLAYLRTHRQR